LSHYREERFDDVGESSHVLEQSLAVLPIFRHDGFGSKSVVEEPLHVVLSSKSVALGSLDDGCEPRA
jgi:hypothetical protein